MASEENDESEGEDATGDCDKIEKDELANNGE